MNKVSIKFKELKKLKCPMKIKGMKWINKK